MALKYIGIWQPCPDYNIDNVVSHDGDFWKAAKQNAGKEPDINTPEYWIKLTDSEKEQIGPASGVVYHNATLAKDGTPDCENSGVWGHLGENELEAVVNADSPSADNPFVTRSSIPDLAKNIGDAQAVDLPDGVTFVYGAHFDDINKVLAIASDDVIAWYFTKDKEWKVAEIAGAWRDIINFGDKWVTVGVNCAASGTPEAMTAHNIMQGDYVALASSGSKVIAVGNGVQSITSDGVSWDSKAVDAGGCEGVCFDEKLGKFIRVGKAGAFEVDGSGDAVKIDGFPDGTWRDIARGKDVTVACSGKLAYKRDSDNTWRTSDTYIGGWDGIAEGAGFIVGVTNGKAGFANSVSGTFGELSIPSYIYTGVTYGASAFWAYGSKLVRYNVRDVAAALNAAEDPNADNPFGTASSIDKMIVQAFIDFTNRFPQLGDKQTFITDILNQLAPNFVTEIRNAMNSDPTIKSMIQAIVHQEVPGIVTNIYDTNSNGILDRAERADSATNATNATRADTADSVDVSNIIGLEAYLQGLGLVNPGQGATDPTTLIAAIRNFAHVSVNGQDIDPDTNEDRIELDAGDNVTLTVNGKKITISANMTTDAMLATSSEWATGTATDKAPSVAQVMQKVSPATTSRAGIAKLAVVPGADDQGAAYTASAVTPAYVKAVLEAM